MGYDIFSWAETIEPAENRWTALPTLPFGDRNYELFRFLLAFRGPCGLPEDCDVKGGCAAINAVEPVEDCKPSGDRAEVLREFTNHCWVLAPELHAFDYDGTGRPYREWLGGEYFKTLDMLLRLGDPQRARVVFFFAH